MLVVYFTEGLVRVDKASARKSPAGLRVSPLAAKFHTPLLLERFLTTGAATDASCASTIL